MIYTLECAGRELLRRKGRTVTTVLGYAFAVVLSLVLYALLYYSKHEKERF